MREHNKAFCRLISEYFDCPTPVYEFGSYQVEGQEGFADLRRYFPGKPYVGCDMRPGPGVDRVEDVSATTLPDACAGTVICLETFEHVFEVRRAFDEVFRILRPGGLFILTSPFHFKIHAHPDDYWRMTPSCLRRMLAPYAARIAGGQGAATTPHTVMSLAVKAPAPADFAARAERLKAAYASWLELDRSGQPPAAKLRRALSQVYRSKAERRQVREFNALDLVVETSPALLSRVS